MSGMLAGAKPARRSSIRSSSAAGDSSPSTATLTVMRASPRWRASDTSGSTSEAGASGDHSGEAPPSSAKAKPPTKTGPEPAGSPSAPSARARRPSACAAAATSQKRPGPRASRAVACPRPASTKPSRSGCSKQKKRSSPARRAASTTAERSSAGSTGTVTEASARAALPPRPRERLGEPPCEQRPRAAAERERAGGGARDGLHARNATSRQQAERLDVRWAKHREVTVVKRGELVLPEPLDQCEHTRVDQADG